MPQETGSYLRPRTIERIFGHVLAWLVRVGVVRGHFNVPEVRGRKSGRTIALPVDGGAALSGVRARQFQLGSQCPRGWRGRARPRDAPATLRGSRGADGHAPASPQGLPRSLRARGATILSRRERFADPGIRGPGAALSRVRAAGIPQPSPLREGARGRGRFQYRCYRCRPCPLPQREVASSALIAHSKHACSARRSRKSAKAAVRPLAARENPNVRRRRMDRSVNCITASGLPIVHLRAMPLHLFRARS